MTPLVLSVLAVLLSGPVPRLLLRWQALRTVPRAAMTLWQAVALAAVLSALGAGLSLATDTGPRVGARWYVVATVALLVTLVVLGRLLLSGHRVGTRLRAARREHRELVDLLTAEQSGVRVLETEVPMAYCVPGLARSRVVVSAGAFGRLATDELAAVLAHERAHLRARHDLVVEAFTVLHEAFPRFVSSGEALREVRLLAEVLADRAARRCHGVLPLARALVTLADGPAPEVALSVAGSELTTRIGLLRDERPHRLLASVVYAAAAAILALPTAFVVLPWLASIR